MVVLIEMPGQAIQMIVTQAAWIIIDRMELHVSKRFTFVFRH